MLGQKVSEISSSKNENNIEVWEDLVNLKSLVFSILVCSTTTLGGYFLAPNTPPKPLFFGLFGAFLGFIICSILVKPKRIILEEKRED